MIIDHNHPEYIERRKSLGKGKYNGCYYYSREIVENIIPLVQTNRDWNTIGRDVEGMHSGMIVFLHDNSTPWNYDWLKKYDDLILVCSSKYTMDSVCYSGRTIFLPMSVDTEYVKKFRTKKTKDTCFVGNSWVKTNIRPKSLSTLYDTPLKSPTQNSFLIPGKVDFFSSLPREKLLKELAKYKRAYAIDRCAIEAKVLGCDLLKLDTRYSVDNVGSVLDNAQAAEILQKKLDEIDGRCDEQRI